MTDGSCKIRWSLRYSELSSEELAMISQLFDNMQGRLGTFTFLDPTNNLLTWSEDCLNPAWRTDPLLQAVEAVQDAAGGTNATRITNAAQTSQRLMQFIEGPAWYRYCFSIYLRSQQTGEVRLVQSATGGEIAQATALSPIWTRVWLSAALPAVGDGIGFGLELKSGMQVDIYGAQVEAQSGAGEYKKTFDRSGVYSCSRFDQDALIVRTTGPNRHSSQIRIVSSLTTN